MSRDFDEASTNYMTYAGAILTTTPMSMSALINIDTLGSDKSILQIGTAGSNNNLWQLRVSSSDNAVAFCRTTSNASATSAGTVSTGVWTQVGAIFGSSTSRYAVLEGTISTENTTSRAPSGVDETKIGRSGISAIYMDGRIAEVGLWNTSLDQNDWTMLAKKVSPLYVKPASLVAYWPLIGRNSPEIDLVGGFSMTLTDAPAQFEHCPVLKMTGRPMMDVR